MITVDHLSSHPLIDERTRYRSGVAGRVLVRTMLFSRHVVARTDTAACLSLLPCQGGA